MVQTKNVTKANQEPSELEKTLQAIVKPLQDEVQSLKQQQVDEKAAQALTATAAADAERKAQLEADADLKAMLDSAGDGDNVEDKYEKLSNRQLIDVLGTAVETAIAANSDRLRTEVAELSKGGQEKVNRIEKAVMSLVAGLGLAETRKQFKDFDEYKEDIAKVLEKNPTLNWEDAYFIAKSKRAGNVSPKSKVDTEKPGNYGTVPVNIPAAAPGGDMLATIAARGAEARSGTVVKSGIVAFRQAAAAAAEKVLTAKE